jgi:hypothetical protein
LGPTEEVPPKDGYRMQEWIMKRFMVGVCTSVRVEVFSAVAMKNFVFWDIKTEFVLHRRHITSPLQSPAG